MALRQECGIRADLRHRGAEPQRNPQHGGTGSRRYRAVGAPRKHKDGNTRSSLSLAFLYFRSCVLARWPQGGQRRRRLPRSPLTQPGEKHSSVRLCAVSPGRRTSYRPDWSGECLRFHVEVDAGAGTVVTLRGRSAVRSVGHTRRHDGATDFHCGPRTARVTTAAASTADGGACYRRRRTSHA
jgi:hypothetical protein